MKVLRVAASATVLGLLAGCSGDSSTEAPSDPASAPTSGSAGTPVASSTAGTVAGTVVRFRSGETVVDVTIDQDSPAARDFLDLLPLTVELRDFAGTEKIADLPRELDRQDTPGSDPEDGDLIYYVPWGNLGFYYNASGIGFSEQTLHLGTYRASVEQLEALTGQDVTVEVLPS